MTRRGDSFPLRLVCNTPGCEGATITMGGDLRRCWPLQSRITHELELNQARRAYWRRDRRLEGLSGQASPATERSRHVTQSPSGLRGLRNRAAGALSTDNYVHVNCRSFLHRYQESLLIWKTRQ